MILIIILTLYLSVVLGMYFRTSDLPELYGKRKLLFIIPILALIIFIISIFDKNCPIKVKISIAKHFDFIMLLTMFNILEITKELKAAQLKNKKHSNAILTRFIFDSRDIYCDISKEVFARMV